MKARPSGPPLNSLRAFEAAARLESFSDAADELCVTAAAIAQQVKILEQWANMKLFERMSKGVKLTPAGNEIREDLGEIFDRIGQVTQKLRSISSPNHVQIATLPSIAQFWLSKVLPDIRNCFSGTTISVSTTVTPPNMNREPIDICLYFDENPDSTFTHILSQDVMYPVCSPSLEKTLQNRETQNEVALFHDSHWHQDWDTWLSNSQEMDSVDTRGSVFTLYSLAIEEVKSGAGAMIGHELLVRPYLETGELVKPFKTEVKLDRWLTINVSNRSLRNPVVNQIVEFLIDGSKSKGANQNIGL